MEVSLLPLCIQADSPYLNFRFVFVLRGPRASTELGGAPCSASATIATAAGGTAKQMETARSAALPGGSLAKACNYTLTLWQKLARFLEYPELELSNNLAENSMRPVALGRRNWIHVGSAQAGPKIAAILSVVESCRRLKLPVRDYLAAVLPGLADCPIQRLPELTPAAMVTQRY